MIFLRSYALLGTARCSGPWGGAGEELQTQPGLPAMGRAATEASLRNVTRPHRLRTYQGTLAVSGQQELSTHELAIASHDTSTVKSCALDRNDLTQRAF